MTDASATVSLRQAAKLLRMNPPDVLKCCETGGLPPARRIGRLYRLQREPVEQLAARRAEDRESAAEAVQVRRQRVAGLHGQGLSVVAIADKLGCGSSTVQRDIEALGLTPHPVGAPSKYPKPQARTCAARDCEVLFTPKPAQAARGDGRYCSPSCYMREAWTLAREAFAEQDLPDVYALAKKYAFSPGIVRQYKREGHFRPIRRDGPGFGFDVFDSEETERALRALVKARKQDPRRREKWLDEDYVVSIYQGKGLIVATAAKHGLSEADAEGIVRERVRRKRDRLAKFRRGRNAAPYHREWVELFLRFGEELASYHSEHIALGFDDAPPTKCEIASAVAEYDYPKHPERFPGYPSACDGSLHPDFARPAANMVWQAVKKPLQNAHRQ